jgi:Ca2+-binding RTX toxin-like protein
LTVDGALVADAGIPPVQSLKTVNIDGTLFVGGSGGADRIILSAASGGIIVRMNNVAGKPQSVGSKIVIFGNGGNDTITTPSTLSVAVEFHGGDGDDYLAGGSRSDTLDGGAGKDRLLGGGGADFLYGGAGPDNLSGGVGNDYLSGDEMIDLSTGEPIDSGDAGRDTLNGEAGNDILVGGAGNDLLYGGGGNDELHGDDDSDKLDGGDGHDLLLGGAGADQLIGRAGRDILIGGEGADSILGGTSADILFGGHIEESDAVLLWNTGIFDSQQAADELAALAIDGDDGAVDSLHGESDADWYLMFLSTGDVFKQAAENKLPNKIVAL